MEAHPHIISIFNIHTATVGTMNVTLLFNLLPSNTIATILNREAICFRENRLFVEGQIILYNVVHIYYPFISNHDLSITIILYALLFFDKKSITYYLCDEKLFKYFSRHVFNIV